MIYPFAFGLSRNTYSFYISIRRAQTPNNTLVQNFGSGSNDYWLFDFFLFHVSVS